MGEAWEQSQARKAAPQDFHTDGAPKSEEELWEDSLRCAWSEDTGRCACYQPDGQKADLTTEECRKFAERGSILKQ